MATVRTNPIVSGLSGMLGQTIGFKNLRGKTIMANRPSPPQKQSEQQKTNRSKFRDASRWAHLILRDPAKKEYYQKKAKKLKLPNAYTAAITDYMRKPKVMTFDNYNNSITCTVSKKNFELKKAELLITMATGDIKETRAVIKDACNEWTFRLSKEELRNGVIIRVTDDAGSIFHLRI